MPEPRGHVVWSGFIGRIRALRGDQSGFAVPTALMALIASFGLASVAVISTVDVQQGTSRDHASKEAIAAADAGANVAMLRLNRFVSRLTPTSRCVGPSGEVQTASATGWCPFGPTERTGGATYRYSVSAYVQGAPLQVVSIGTAGRVSRRVNVSMTPEVGKSVFGPEQLIGEKKIEANGNVTVNANVGTNGPVTKAGGSGSLCGNERIGIGKAPQTNWAPECEGKRTEGNRTLPAVVPPANIATSNSNCRLSATCTNTKEVDTWSKKNGYNAVKRELSLSQSSTLTMGGENYWLCKLESQNGTIVMPAGAHVRIFIDTPEHCGLGSGATQVNLKGTIKSSAYEPKENLFEMPGIYVVGNGAANIEGNSGTENLTLYAPLSRVEIGGNAEWIGMFAGKEINLYGNPTITYNEKIKPPEITYPPSLTRSRYVECSGATTTTSEGC